MTRRDDADAIVRTHMLWACGAGLMPLPLLDLAAVTAIQMDLLNDLARLYRVDASTAGGKTFVSALAGSTLAKIGASVVKSLPGIGSVVGGISMSALAGASTFALGEVIINQLEQKGDFLSLDMGWAKEAYAKAYERGKEVLKNTPVAEQRSRDVYQSLEKLGRLKAQGVITEAEFAEQKRRLLDQL